MLTENITFLSGFEQLIFFKNKESNAKELLCVFSMADD